MKLLVTGAAHFDSEQLNTLSSLGFEVVFQQDEAKEPVTDYSTVDAVICNGLFLYHGIEEFTNLKLIQLTSAGLDRVPLDRINQSGISVFNARGVYSVPMAEFAVAGVLSLYKKLDFFFNNQKEHIWKKERNLKELCGSTVAVVGFGSVGNECAKRFRAFGTHIIGVDIVDNCSDCDEFFLLKDIRKALNKADIVILTLPLTDETRGMFDRQLLNEFKEDALLVNIARGAVVNEKDLYECLTSGRLGGAVLDVFEEEPLSESSGLWELNNVVITPHNSFVSPENTDRLFNVAYANLKAFAEGK